MNDASDLQHLVLPGQVIAVSSDNEDSFLRGHGTYLERSPEQQQRLIATCVGTVQRVNKLISVQPITHSLYQPSVGDLVVGRVMTVGNNRWNIQLTAYSRTAALPLSGVHLPGGVQRIRTAQDAREMRLYLQEGDLISAEVHKVAPGDGTVFLHTRSVRYGRLENGLMCQVPPRLVPRRKTHWTNIVDGEVEIDVLLGCNGMIWLQRKLPSASGNVDASGAPSELAELHERRRMEHATTPTSLAERQVLARVRNCVECLRQTCTLVTGESLQQVYESSKGVALPEMLEPPTVVRLTADQRQEL